MPCRPRRADCGETGSGDPHEADWAGKWSEYIKRRLLDAAFETL